MHRYQIAQEIWVLNSKDILNFKFQEQRAGKEKNIQRAEFKRNHGWNKELKAQREKSFKNKHSQQSRNCMKLLDLAIKEIYNKLSEQLQGLVLQHSSLSYHLLHQNPPWTQVWVPAAPFAIQLPAMTLARQHQMAQVLGSLHPHGRPKWNSKILSSPWPSVAIAAIWGATQHMEDF